MTTKTNSHVVNWFEIPVQSLPRAQSFYEKVLGVSLSPMEKFGFKMAWFPMNQGSPGSTGCLMQGEGYAPSKNGTLVYLTVDDLDKSLSEAKALGSEIIQEKTTIGEYGSIAKFVDCEGNRVALHSIS
jgi:predicted enzyme related to lactoylglutathione lyase